MTDRRILLGFVIQLGEFTLFFQQIIKAWRRLWHRRALLFRHCNQIGVTSTGIVAVAGMFMGAVMGYQFYVGFSFMGAEELLGGSVGVSIFRELASSFTAIMVTGRAGAAIAAELASMRISEQIDAMEVMGVNPIEYLCAPRVVAGTAMMPLLGMIFAAVASVSAAGVACGVMGLSWAVYWQWFTFYVDWDDMVHTLVKSGLFGLVMTSIACFYGFKARGGARAVGAATRTTVVVSFLAILLTDYVLTTLLPIQTGQLMVD